MSATMELPQEKEWVPRSHIPGAFGTFTRAAAQKAKLWEQYREEEEEATKYDTGRPDINSSYIEIAFIKTKDARDGKRVESIFNDLQQDGGAGEGLHTFGTAIPGKGNAPSAHVYVSIGSAQAFEDMIRMRSEQQTVDLKMFMKRYQSIIISPAVTDEMKKLVDTLNQGKCYNIQLLENKMYALPDGWRGVKRFVDRLEDKLLVRIQEISFESEDAKKEYLKAYEAYYTTAEHRLTREPKYRAYKSPGELEEFTAPVDFFLDTSEKDLLVIVVDDVDSFAQDLTSEALTEADTKVQSGNYYFLGDGAEAQVIQDHVKALQGRKMFANIPEEVF